MKQAKHKMALALGLMLLGAIGLVAAQYTGTNEGIFDGQEDDCGLDWNEEESILDEIDAAYEENEDAFVALEDEIEGLYEGLDNAVAAGDDAHIVLLVKQIYAKEDALEALEEQIGIASLYDELDSLYGEDDAFEQQ